MITQGVVRIFSLGLACVPQPAWPVLHALLNDEEQRQAASFYQLADRHSYIAAHALLRQVLTGWFGRPPQAWRFAAGEHGKPELAAGENLPDIRFSLSHARGMVLVSVAHGIEVGADAAEVANDGVSREIAERYFAPQEAAALRALTNDEAFHERFAVLWALKEAFLKAIGTGLSRDLASFAFESADPVRLTFLDATLGDPARWRFWQAAEGRFRLAAAFAVPEGQTVQLHYRAARCSAAGQLLIQQ